jgi:hypothetical protein
MPASVIATLPDMTGETARRLEVRRHSLARS